MDDERDLAWAGMYNVRDLGGLPTADGGTTRFGAVVRSEGLVRLEPAGWAALEGHGIRTCIDLRSDFELAERPYQAGVSGVAILSAPWEEGLLDDPEFRDWAESGVLGTALYFAPFLERWPRRTAEVVRAVANAGPGGVLYHCQRGRDRTGLLTMLLLSVVGVPDEVIVADHLRTDDRLIAQGIGLGHVSLDGEAELFASRGTTAEATLFELLAGLNAADYLLDAGLTAKELDAIRKKLRP